MEAVVLMGRTAHADLFARPTAKDREVTAHMLDRLGIAPLAQRPYTVIPITLRAADRAYLLRGGEGPVQQIQTRERLEALYGAPVQTITDESGTAFIPG